MKTNGLLSKMYEILWEVITIGGQWFPWVTKELSLMKDSWPFCSSPSVVGQRCQLIDKLIEVRTSIQYFKEMRTKQERIRQRSLISDLYTP